MATIENKDEAYKLSKELIGNNDKIAVIRAKMKADKENIKAFDERNEVIMGELRVHVEGDNIGADSY